MGCGASHPVAPDALPPAKDAAADATPHPHLQVEPAFLNEPEYDYSANAWDIDF